MLEHVLPDLTTKWIVGGKTSDIVISFTPYQIIVLYGSINNRITYDHGESNRTLYNTRKNDLISKFCRLVLTKRVFDI